jgi:putative MATE family efflux protein
VNKERFGLIRSFFVTQAGQSYRTILAYFFPEFITALILYSLPYFVDCFFIGHLKSTEIYTISGVVDNCLNVFVKVAEGLSIGTVAMAGYHNGLKNYKDVGRSFANALWASIIVGGMISCSVYIGGYWMYKLFNFSDHMIHLGLPFLKIRAIAMFFMFVCFAFIGFLRSIKNTFVPMVLFAIGSVVFIFFDYCLIFGKFGFPALGLQGSAVAYLIQYVAMLICAILYVFYFQVNKKYAIDMRHDALSKSEIAKLLWLSFPIAVDKAIMALAYVWLSIVLVPVGQHALANFSVMKLMERMVFLPATAFAQVITFLVSNDIGNNKWPDIKANIIKVLFLSSIMIAVLLGFGSYYVVQIVDLIGHNKEIGCIAAKVFPALSLFVFIDLLQLILSGALRGSFDVQTVMITRVCIIVFYFMPTSYALSLLPIQSDVLKFFIIYSSFFIGNGLMSIVYIKRLAKRQ